MVIIPALNEAGCIRFTVHYWRLRRAAHVRVVDNGSHDATARLAAEAGAEVRLEPRAGYGAAAWSGARHPPPGIEWLLFSAADGSDRLEPEEAAAFDRVIGEGADFVLGERVSEARSRANLRPAQRLGNWLCCSLIELGWGRRFRDLGSLRAIRPATLERLALRDRGFGWNIEMQVRALEERLSIEELPVRYHPRLAGEPKISGNARGTIRAGIGMLRSVLQLHRRRVSAPRGTLAGKENERAFLNRNGCC